jgi:molecular chaperone DnaK
MILKIKKIEFDDIQALQRLTEAAEKAKMELSTVEKQLFTYHSLLLIKQGQNILKRFNTRNFEKLCENLITRCRIQ